MKAATVTTFLIVLLNAAPQKSYAHQDRAHYFVCSLFGLRGELKSTEPTQGTADEKHLAYDWLWEPIRTNWPLVLVGIFGVLAAVRTLKRMESQIEEMKQQRGVMDGQLTQMTSQVTEMQKQTTLIGDSVNAAKESADAALLNAQAVLDSERPWLIVTVEKNEAVARPGYFFFRVTNRGRTPARLIEGGTNHAFRTRPDELPVPPDYQPFLLPINTFLAPNDSFCIRRTLAETSEGVYPEGIIAAHKNGPGPSYAGETLFFYGLLVYEDIVGENRQGYVRPETRFCFAFFSNGLRFEQSGPSGTDEYNRNR
jgi:hypothetical protein